MQLKLQHASPKDAERVFAIYRACRELPTCTWSEYYPTLEDVKDDIRKRELFIAMDDSDTLIGAVAACADDENDEEAAAFRGIWTGDDAHAAYLSRFGVLPELQGRGLGGQILDAVLAELVTRGFSAARLLVSRINPSAVQLYTSRGFLYKGDVYLYEREWLCMERALDNGATGECS